MWELPSGRQIISTRPTQEKVSVAALSPDGRFAVFALTDGTVRLWSLTAERELWRQSVNGISEGLWYEATFSTDGEAWRSLVGLTGSSGSAQSDSIWRIARSVAAAKHVL